MKTELRTFALTFAAAAFLCGCGKGSGEPDTPDGPDTPVDPVTPVEKVYSVGDYYSKGFVKGIVISVDKGEDGVQHGLIVSLNESEAAWAYRYDDVMSGQPGTGAYNTGCVQKLSGWKDYYPAFVDATSANVGALKDWFLPSMNELAKLYEAYTGHETNDTEQGTGSLQSASPKAARMSESDYKAKFNKTLTDNKGTALSDAIYWSSSESGPSIAYAFDMQSGKTVDTPSELDKKKVYKVRAMASF